jgi:hypothetical protein
MMMGVVCAEGGRGLTVCPSITVDCVSEDLRCPKNPEERLERREQIRRAAALLQGSVVCYTLWLEAVTPKVTRMRRMPIFNRTTCCTMAQRTDRNDRLPYTC